MQNTSKEIAGLPAGFSYIPGFISEDEERSMLETVAGIELNNFMFQGFEAKRKVASFGYDYTFDAHRLKAGKAIPEAFLPIIEKVADHLRIQPEKFQEVLVTEYPPESVINWHRDAPPFGLVAGISLLSGCIFRLRPHGKDNSDRKAVISFPVGRRSLYVIDGEARDRWEHSIRPVKQLRYSVTLRTLREDSRPGDR